MLENLKEIDKIEDSAKQPKLNQEEVKVITDITNEEIGVAS